MKTSDLLERALARFEGGARWAGHPPRKPGPQECMLTAIHNVAPDSEDRQTARSALRRQLPLDAEAWISGYNDAHGRTFAEVEAVYRAAIAERRAAGD